MENLFKDFEAVGKEAWLEKIRTDLKGKSEDLLNYEVEKGINVNSYQHRSSYPKGTFSISKNANLYSNRCAYGTESNAEILNDLNEGVDHIGLEFTSAEQFSNQTAGVEFEHIKADVKFLDFEATQQFKGPNGLALNADFLGNSLAAGTWTSTKEVFLDFYRRFPNNPTLWINGSQFGEAGSTAVQELAFTANLLNEYLEILRSGGESLENISSKITVELSVTEDYFLNVAKFKVSRSILAAVLKAHGIESRDQLQIQAVTSKRKLAVNDANNNLLRQSTQAMSAIVGGCDSITISTIAASNETHKRMAKNIPLVLKEESYFDKVGDPAEGSYYVEELCTQLSEKSWALFKEIEKAGGYCAAVEANNIQDAIANNRNYLIEQLNGGSKTFLGVNKFPSSLEEWQNIPNNIESETASFKALKPFSLEGHFKRELHEQS